MILNEGQRFLPDINFSDADKEWMLDELSGLTPVNRHYFSAIAPEWMLFNGQLGNQPCLTLATVCLAFI